MPSRFPMRVQGKYRDHYPDLLRNHFDTGGSINEFCTVLKIERGTFFTWLKLHPEFKKARDEFGPANSEKYRDEFPDMLIEHMQAGFSFESFAGIIGVSVQCLRYWEDKFLELKEAKEIGEAARLLKWEKIGIAGTIGQLPNFNASAYKHNIQYHLGLLDKKEAEEDSQTSKVEVHFYIPDNGRDKKTELKQLESGNVIEVKPENENI